MEGVTTKGCNSIPKESVFIGEKKIITITNTVHPLDNTPQCCWWDCHPFTSTAFYMPVYISKQGIFSCKGYFCSANCTKAYILSKQTWDMPRIIALFRLMLKRIYQFPYGLSIIPAPPKESLRIFGGPFDITTFREKSTFSMISLLNKPLHIEIQNIHEIEKREQINHEYRLQYNSRLDNDENIVVMPKRRMNERKPHATCRTPKQPIQHPPLKLYRKNPLLPTGGNLLDLLREDKRKV